MSEYGRFNFSKINAPLANRNEKIYLDIFSSKKKPNEYYPIIVVMQGSYVICEVNKNIKAINTASLTQCYGFFAQFKDLAFVIHVDSTTPSEFLLSGINKFIDKIIELYLSFGNNRENIASKISLYGVSGCNNNPDDMQSRNIESKNISQRLFLGYIRVLNDNGLSCQNLGYTKGVNDVIGIHKDGFFVTTVERAIAVKQYTECYISPCDPQHLSSGDEKKFINHSSFMTTDNIQTAHQERYIKEKKLQR